MPGREECHPRQRRHNGHRRKNLKHRFEIIKTLGQGTYGKVKLAIEKETGESFAIKSIRKKQIGSEQDMARLRREIEIMASLSHPHIISIYEVFENSEKIVIVMEYASGGELYDHCNDKHGLYDDEARKFFRQIVSAVHYLHKNGIVHRDLKLENIVLDANGNAKIADFGFANIYNNEKLLSTFCGSPLYASPEIVNGLPYNGPEVDCWSLGVLLYAMVYGAMPFDGSDFRKLRNQITAGDYFKPAMPSEACLVIERLLCPNPARRFTIEDLAQSWWLNQGYEYTPVEDILPGKPVDQNDLVRKLSEGSSSESDCDLLRTVNCQSKPTPESGATSPCGDGNSMNKYLPIKGILKKPRDGEADTVEDCSEQTVVCKRSKSLDFELTISVPLRTNESASQDKKPARPLSSHIPTSVFDSTKKPKKGILKNSQSKRSDPENTTSGSVPPMADSSSISASPDKSVRDVPTDSSTCYDLLDIEAVLDSLRVETETLCDMEKMLQQSALKDSDKVQATADSGFVEDSSVECSVIEGDLSSPPQSTFHYSHVPSESGDFALQPIESSSNDLVTSTPNHPVLTSGKRKRSILKNRNKYTDPTWRYSAGSQGSTSSGDLLDFSYDSTDGESLLSEYFSMSLPNGSSNTEDTETENALFGKIDLQRLNISEAPYKQSLEEDDEDLGPPPPLPQRPPPNYTSTPSHVENSTPDSALPSPLNYQEDLLENIMWLGNQQVEKFSPVSKSPNTIGWDEVEDIYRKALELQKEWSS